MPEPRSHFKCNNDSFSQCKDRSVWEALTASDWNSVFKTWLFKRRKFWLFNLFSHLSNKATLGRCIETVFHYIYTLFFKDQKQYVTNIHIIYAFVPLKSYTEVAEDML